MKRHYLFALLAALLFLAPLGANAQQKKSIFRTFSWGDTAANSAAFYIPPGAENIMIVYGGAPADAVQLARYTASVAESFAGDAALGPAETANWALVYSETLLVYLRSLATVQQFFISSTPNGSLPSGWWRAQLESGTPPGDWTCSVSYTVDAKGYIGN